MKGTTDTTENGHGTGKAGPGGPVGEGAEGRAGDSQSLGWPRLLTLREAARYLGVSAWTMRQMINTGQVPVRKLKRPATAAALRRRPTGETMRMLRVDRHDLDAFVDADVERVRLSAWGQS